MLINADIDKNAFGLEMGKRLDLQYTCSYNYVEVYVNNGYSGKYILTEHRQADPAYLGAPGRPKAHLTEGWFIEIDRYFPDNEPVKFRTKSYNLPVMIKSPEFKDDIDDPRYDFVKKDLNEIADLMVSDDFPENGYRDLVDAESFIKYFMVQTFMQNVDFFRKGTETGESIGSAFFYRDKGGKIGAGPLWDLNWSFQEISGAQAMQFGNMGPNLYPYVVYPWFARFFDDPVFLVRYKEIWNEKMPQIESMRSFAETALVSDFYDKRLAFLNAEYNKVNVRPLVRDFGTKGYNYSQVPARAVTLVSYGEMSDLRVTLQRGLDFEIASNVNQVSTGKGGYLAAVNVKPKEALVTGYYRDTLVLSGSKQGSEFTFKVPLSFVVSATEEPPPLPSALLPQIARGNKVIPIKNGINLTSATNASIRVYNTAGRAVASYAFAGGVHNISLSNLPHGVYIARVSFGNESKMMRVVVR